MIVIAIIGILASVAVPIYGNHTKRAKFSEIIRTSASVKVAVESCFHIQHKLSGCNEWTEIGINPVLITDAELVDSITLDAASGAITFTGHARDVNGATYVMTPTFDNDTNIFTWEYSGTCKTDAAHRFC